ncbi:methyltransferase domain-containing protein [Winogradskyella sp.]|uniref:methyltransferase domain-containing protein n=1 Tax=Winogradskyella sp. TaxID=1883156 RepID=UPI0034429910|nr:class I SAM-dependent methyltransferase [Winogradskyella sp.]
MVLCFHILEHIEDDIKAMRELYRVLKNMVFVIYKHLLRKLIFTKIIRLKSLKIGLNILVKMIMLVFIR